jgi:prefoldin beta subunit
METWDPIPITSFCINTGSECIRYAHVNTKNNKPRTKAQKPIIYLTERMHTGIYSHFSRTMSSNNPGTVMASAVDAEIATFRTMQESMQQYQSNLQLVQSQRTENEMVLEEFQLLLDAKKTNSGKQVVNVYKMIGPVLMSQNINEAYQTVEKRLQFITTEQTKIQNQMDGQEKLLQEQAKKVQQMQAMLQQSTVQAVQAIAQQHQAA